MTLAFCIFRYFPFGGLQRDFLRIAQECLARGFLVRVYTLDWEGDVPDGFDVRIVPVSAAMNHVRVRRYAEWVKGDLEQNPVAGVVGFNKMPGMDVYYAADACYKEKSLTQRGLLYRLGRRYKQYLSFEEAVFGRLSKTELLMISEVQANFFIKHYGTDRSRMHFLPPNVAPDRVASDGSRRSRQEFRKRNGFSDGTLLVVQIGSGFIKKGVDRSLKSIASLPSKLRERTIFWVVGEDRNIRFRRLANRLGLANQVTFTGPREDIPEILLGADLMLHPAYDENTGTVLVEAVASGLPVLCTAVCGYATHVVQSGCGLVTREPFDQEELDRKLLMLLERSDLDAIGKLGLAYAQSTDLYGMPERAADVIEGLFPRNDDDARSAA